MLKHRKYPQPLVWCLPVSGRCDASDPFAPLLDHVHISIYTVIFYVLLSRHVCHIAVKQTYILSYEMVRQQDYMCELKYYIAYYSDPRKW